MFEWATGKPSYRIVDAIIRVFAKETKEVALGLGEWADVPAQDRLCVHRGMRHVYDALCDMKEAPELTEADLSGLGWTEQK